MKAMWRISPRHGGGIRRRSAAIAGCSPWGCAGRGWFCAAFAGVCGQRQGRPDAFRHAGRARGTAGVAGGARPGHRHRATGRLAEGERVPLDIVGSRDRKRRFESEAALAHRTRGGGVVHLEKVDDAEAGEVRLYCYSEQRAEKERGMAERFAQRLERDLGALHEGLSRPRTRKDPDKIRQRIGRLREKSRGVGQHYDIAVATDESGKRAVAVTFRRKPVAGTMLTLRASIACAATRPTGAKSACGAPSPCSRMSRRCSVP